MPRLPALLRSEGSLGGMLGPVIYCRLPSSTRASVKRVAWHGWLNMKPSFVTLTLAARFEQLSMGTARSCEAACYLGLRLWEGIPRAECARVSDDRLQSTASGSCHPFRMQRLSTDQKRPARCRSEASGLTNQPEAGPFWTESRRGATALGQPRRTWANHAAHGWSVRWRRCRSAILCWPNGRGKAKRRLQSVRQHRARLIIGGARRSGNRQKACER